jgi:hypothetical protein
VPDQAVAKRLKPRRLFQNVVLKYLLALSHPPCKNLLAINAVFVHTRVASARTNLHFKLREDGMTTIKSTYPEFRKKAPLAAAISTFMVAAILLAGCAVKFIGDYDDTIDKGVTDVQQRTELYMAKLQSTPTTPYDQTFYDDIDARLAVLKSRASSLPKYPIIVEQIGNLRSQVDTFQKLDKSSSRPFPSVVITDAESAIAVSVESILKLELALKERGQVSAPSLTKSSK